MYAYELDRNFVQVSVSCGPQSARAQFIVDAQTVTRIQDSGEINRDKTRGVVTKSIQVKGRQIRIGLSRASKAQRGEPKTRLDV